jgi:uncharacterized protein
MIVQDNWLLCAQRLVIHLPTATAVVADLHLGYDDCRRRGGEAVPFVDLAQQLEPLGKAIKKQSVRRLVIAGDLFEAGYCSKLARDFQQWLADTGAQLTAIVPGNHDRALTEAQDFGPIYPDGFMLDGWRILHGNEEIPRGRVVHGHLHPSIRRQGRKSPCFLMGNNRLVLPAYSLDAAGVNVAKDRTWHGFRCYAIRAGRVVRERLFPPLPCGRGS